MSYAPCANCRRTNGGRLFYFYLATFEKDRQLQYRLRLCQECSLSLVSDLLNVADRKDDDGIWRTSEWWG